MKFVESPEELVSECEQLAVSQVNGFLRSHPRVPSHEVVRPQLDPPQRSHGVEDVGAVVWGEQRVQEFLDVTGRKREEEEKVEENVNLELSGVEV